MVPESTLAPDPGRWRATARVAVLCSLLLAGCAAPPERGHEMLNAVLWQQDSAEYRALARQSYVLAALRLDQALDAPRWTAALEQDRDPSALPPAVVLDLDETVLDNARYEARIVTTLGEYSRESFASWCREVGVTAVPGAIDFLEHARARGVNVFYYTAREERLRECTLQSLEAVGVPGLDPARVFLRGDGDKSEIRRRLAASHRIVLLIGDSLEDFVHGSKGDPRSRRELVRRHAARFGERWIVLPNPVYGHWEAVRYGFDYRAPRATKLESKRSALEP